MSSNYKPKLTVETSWEAHNYLRGLPHGQKTRIFRTLIEQVIAIHKEGGDVATEEIAAGLIHLEEKI